MSEDDSLRWIVVVVGGVIVFMIFGGLFSFPDKTSKEIPAPVSQGVECGYVREHVRCND